jgi:small subunit ribosomal protein S16
MRLGKKRSPHYRIVIADARNKRDGRVIEEIGKYHPKEDPSFIEVNGERAAYWLGVGAQPTEAVTAIFKVTGDWQKFKGLPAPPPMLTAEPKTDKLAVFEAAAKEAAAEPKAEATTPKKRAAKKAAAEETPAEETPAGETPAGETPAEETPAGETAEAAPAEEAPAAEAAAEEAPTEA